MTLAATGPNAEQISYWNEISGPKWVALGDTIDQQISIPTLDKVHHAAFANVDIRFVNSPNFMREFCCLKPHPIYPSWLDLFRKSRTVSM